MSNHVVIKVGADGAGFDRTMKHVEDKVNHVAHKSIDGLKEAFIGFVGAASAGALVEHMTQFAETISHAADNLGLTTDRVQQLRIAARQAGKDLSAFDSVFTNLEKGASKGLVSGSKESKAAAKLGVSQADLAHLNKDDLLKALLKGTEGMDRTVAEQALGAFTGKKNAGWLIGDRENILSGAGNIVDKDSLAALNEFKDTLEDLSDMVNVSLIPALVSLVEFITKNFARTVQGSRTMDEMDKEAQSLYMQKHNGQLPSGGFTTQAAYQVTLGAISANPFQGEKSKDEMIKRLQRGTIAKIYGEDVAAELEKTFVPSEKAKVLDTLEDVKARRKKEREARDKEITGPVNREAPLTNTKKEAALLSENLSAGNEYLKIGGTLGIDSAYRMERLNQRMVELLQAIKENTDPVNASDSEDPSGATE